MNGKWWGTTSGKNMLRKPHHFGPTWPEVMGLVPRYRENEQKSTCAGRPLQGAKWKMDTVFARDYFLGFFEVTKN
jgi:hypothetical protein